MTGHDVANKEFLCLTQVLIPFKFFMDRDLSIISYPRFRSVCALQSSQLHIYQICTTRKRAVGDSEILFEEAELKLLNLRLQEK